MSEVTEMLKDKAGLSDTTKKNYVNQHKTIVRIIGENIKETSEDTILEKLKDTKPNVMKLYLNLCILVRRHFKLGVDKLEAKRDELKKEIDEYYEDKKANTDLILPDYKEVVAYTNKLYRDKEYVKFIINYLMINYGVRNKDVDVFITDSAKKVSDTINYIVLGKNQATWVINDYKTIKNYGAKKIIIKAKKFLDALNKIPMNAWLLNNGTEHIQETGLATTLKRMLFNNFTEGTYFKIIMKYINTQPNSINLLQYYSQTRGTDYQSLVKYYNTDQNKIVVKDDDDDEDD